MPSEMMFGERVTENSLLQFIRNQVTKGAQGITGKEDKEPIKPTPEVDPSRLDPQVLMSQIQTAQAQIAIMEAEVEQLRLKKAPTEVE